jgi:hypothetical protein
VQNIQKMKSVATLISLQMGKEIHTIAFIKWLYYTPEQFNQAEKVISKQLFID